MRVNRGARLPDNFAMQRKRYDKTLSSRVRRGLSRVGQDDLPARHAGCDQGVDQGLVVDVALDDAPVAHHADDGIGLHDPLASYLANGRDSEELLNVLAMDDLLPCGQSLAERPYQGVSSLNRGWRGEKHARIGLSAIGRHILSCQLSHGVADAVEADSLYWLG